MSSFEIILIVLVCAVPIVALLFILPKFKKKEKKVEEQTKTLADLKQEENKSEVVKETPIKKEFVKDEISSSEIQSYIDFKKKNLSKPKRVEMPKDFKDITMPYTPRRRRSQDKKPQSVAEEIQNLSPELKALIISGVLDPKNFDKI